MSLVHWAAMRGRKLRDHRRVWFCLLAIVAGCGLCSWLATAGVKVNQTLTGDEAIQHLDETNTVCGMVASAKYAAGAPGNPTYLNFDRPYPNQSCAVVIAGTARARFKEAPENVLTGKWVCVTGVITSTRHGKAQIAVTDPAQIVVEDAAAGPATN